MNNIWKMLHIFSLFHLNSLCDEYFYSLPVEELEGQKGWILVVDQYYSCGSDSRDQQLQLIQLRKGRHNFWRPKNTCLPLSWQVPTKKIQTWPQKKTLNGGRKVVLSQDGTPDHRNSHFKRYQECTVEVVSSIV